MLSRGYLGRVALTRDREERLGVAGSLYVVRPYRQVSCFGSPQSGMVLAQVMNELD